MRPIRREAALRLETGQHSGIPKTDEGCREIRKRRQALWTCVRHKGVEPTNQAAERAIRPGVLWRTGSIGTHGPAGSRFLAVMMTVVATLKQQYRHVLGDLTAACEVALRGETAPSLLPTPDQRHAFRRPAAYLDRIGERLLRRDKLLCRAANVRMGWILAG
jgi:transposase